MTFHRPRLMAALAAIVIATSAQAQTVEPVDNPGRVLASNCFQCHGTDGRGTRGGFEGIEADEVVSELREFAQSQPRGDEGIMVIHAQAYSAVQIALIADYLAGACTGSCGEDDDETASVQVTLHISGTSSGDVVADDAGLTCTGRCDERSARLPQGQTVALSAVPAQGRQFRGWRGGCSGRAPTCVLTLTQEREVTARFSRR